MGKKDIRSKLFWEDNARFADLINTVFGCGEEVIQASDLEESGSVLDIAAEDHRQEIIESHKIKEGQNIREIEKRRDIVRKIAKGTHLILIGIENQENIHYAMPVRVMQMDVMEYDKQLRELSRNHRNAKDLKKGAEYLSGLSQTDRLNPVCTITLYYGKEPWHGPECLHDLLDMEGVPEELRPIFPNYPLTLIEVRRYPDWEKFKTDLREVFGFIQKSENKENLKEFLKENREKFQMMPEEAVDLLKEVTGIKNMQVQKKEDGGIDMCKAIDDMIQEGIEQAQRDKLLSLIKKKLQKGKTQEEIAEDLEEEVTVIHSLILKYF